MNEKQLGEAIFNEPNLGTRLTLIVDVGRNNYTSLIPKLDTLARDESYVVRIHALRALILFMTSKPHLPLAFALLADDPESSVRIEAASCLGMMAMMVPETAPDIAKRLSAALRTESSGTVKNAIYGGIFQMLRRDMSKLPRHLADSDVDWELIAGLESGSLLQATPKKR